MFVFATEEGDNELMSLEVIHRYVFSLHRYFEGICEYDMIYNFEKCHYLLDELISAGELAESAIADVVNPVRKQDELQKLENTKMIRSRRKSDIRKDDVL